MKALPAIFLTLLCLAATPARADLCKDAEGQKEKYVGIWKSLFTGRNKADAEFLKRVNVERAELNCWNRGISLNVYYTVTTGWAAAQAHDQFLISIRDPDGVIGAEGIPHDTLLDETQIRQLKKTFAPELTTIKPHERLIHATRADAEAAIKNHVQGAALSQTSLAYYVPGMVPRVNGDPYLVFHATRNELQNKCVNGNMNLVTGVITAHDTACVIY